MAKFNGTSARPAVASPVVTEAVPSARTHEGAPGYVRDAQSELFLLAVSNMVGEGTFYESASDRDSRYVELVKTVAVADPEWMTGFLPWLRGEGNMRSASLVGALEAAHAMLAAEKPGARQLVASVLQRADEPGEALAYWTSRYGRMIPKPVKRGVADAVARLYTERALLKYDTASKGYRFGDVIDLVHPTSDTAELGQRYEYALDRRHGRDKPIPDLLGFVCRNVELRARAVEDPTVLLDPVLLHGAAMTWEDVLSLAGSKVSKKDLWEALAPTLGYMAALRNLRNMDEAGVSDDVAADVAARLADPEQVAKSRQLPMRFLAAYRAAPSLRWGHALDRALTASLGNVPELPGRTLILVDVSGSMIDRMSEKSDLLRCDAAGVFAAALALRSADPTLVWFNGGSGQIPIRKGGSLLKLVEAVPKPNGGTDTAGSVQRWYAGHDRVIVVTDEQAHYGRGGVDASVPANVPLYTWNLGGYRVGHTPSGMGTRHTFGGLTDACFRMIPLLEMGRDAGWPWSD